MNDLNNKNMNSISSKLRKCSMLLKYVHDKLINNQEIARLVKYTSKNPLSKKGILYSGEKVEQPDLTEDDVKDLITLLPFNPQMDIKAENRVFLNIPTATFTSSNVLYLNISVVVQIEYFEITTGLRIYEIAHAIANMLDGMYITDESYLEELGNLRFKVEDAVIERLSSNSNTVLCDIMISVPLFPIDRVVRK